MTAVALIVAQLAFAVWSIATQPQSAMPTAHSSARLAEGVGAFELGYDDGCMSAMSANSTVYARFVRDMYLYVHHEAYREGWDLGARKCR